MLLCEDAYIPQRNIVGITFSYELFVNEKLIEVRIMAVI